MWRNFRYFHSCHAYKSKISPHDKFFSTYLICDICDKYQVCEYHYSVSTIRILFKYRIIRSPLAEWKWAKELIIRPHPSFWEVFSTAGNGLGIWDGVGRPSHIHDHQYDHVWPLIKQHFQWNDDNWRNEDLSIDLLLRWSSLIYQILSCLYRSLLAT